VLVKQGSVKIKNKLNQNSEFKHNNVEQLNNMHVMKFNSP